MIKKGINYSNETNNAKYKEYFSPVYLHNHKSITFYNILSRNKYQGKGENNGKT